MNRWLSFGCLAALLTVALLAVSVAQAGPPPIPLAADPCTTEPNTNRGGQDYTHFDTASPGACRIACENDAQCKAYTYVKPGIQGPSAVCWLKNGVPGAASDTCCTSGVKQAGPPPPPGPGGADQGDEPFTNRPGKDYTSQNLPAANPGLCKAACMADPQCKAFTYVKPGLQGPQAKCWLKNDVPAAVADTCCSSGVKSAPPPPPGPGGADQGDEPYTNRPGKDYTSMNLPAANPGLCKAACMADPQCKAFTYVKPGLQGPQAKCWLKNDVPAAVADTCCSSGVKSAPPPPPGPGGADQGDEPFKNRPGKDYTSMNLAAANPGLCKAACLADPQCKAFTYVKPGVQGPQAKCWLKNDVPAAVSDPCCSSGVKSAPPPPGPGGADQGDEPFKNRPGKDYTSMNLAAANPGLCKAACLADPQCKAFTYVKPGVQGPQAKCWLKNDVPAAVSDPCCSSGVKSAGGADQGDEPLTNRPGKDYTSMNLATANPGLCKAACLADPQCKAFTYVKPGVQGPQAKCWLKNDVPAAVSDPCCSSGVKSAGGADQGDEPLTNRPGKDYTSMNLATANPGLCKAACLADPQCKAFTYVKPGVQGPQAKCWLKNAVPAAVSDPCCSSGVKSAGGADQGDEPLTNRPGKDYTSMNLAAANPGLCKAACLADPQCKAYTYVKPGLQGPQAKCWLKNAVPPAVPDTCCSSGVKSAPPPPPGPGGADQGEEPFTNRPGKDYTSMNLAAADPGLCKAACMADPQCKAYTYVKPGLQGPQAKCWLKNAVPLAVPDPCCSSGVKSGGPPPPPPGPGGADMGEEPFTNRPGKDYTNFTPIAADPGLCKLACDSDPLCQAYTYVKPGVQGPSARCWLKNGVPPAKPDTCCSSGVKPPVVIITPDTSGGLQATPQSSDGLEDCIVFDPAAIQVQQIGGRWKIVQGTTWLFDFGGSQANAQLAYDIIQKNGFSQVCFIGRPAANFMYFVGQPALPTPTPTPAAASSVEDCIPFDPSAAMVSQIGGRWKVVVGDMWMLDFESHADEANLALQIIQTYGMTSQCFVGRPNPPMQYYLVNGSAPSGALSGEDCIAFDPATIQMQQVGGSWKIMDGSSSLLDFAGSQANAQLAFDLIQKFGFTNICFVGRPDAPMMYFRR